MTWTAQQSSENKSNRTKSRYSHTDGGAQADSPRSAGLCFCRVLVVREIGGTKARLRCRGVALTAGGRVCQWGGPGWEPCSPPHGCSTLETINSAHFHPNLSFQLFVRNAVSQRPVLPTEFDCPWPDCSRKPEDSSTFLTTATGAPRGPQRLSLTQHWVVTIIFLTAYWYLGPRSAVGFTLQPERSGMHQIRDWSAVAPAAAITECIAESIRPSVAAASRFRSGTPAATSSSV